MAHAARTTLVTVEEIRDTDLLDDEITAAGTLPAMYVGAIAEAPMGAWPLGLPGFYEADAGHIRAYAREARTEEGFRAYLAREVMAAPAKTLGMRVRAAS
jgi:glutaconate CoA-transferase subunit A